MIASSSFFRSTLAALALVAVGVTGPLVADAQQAAGKSIDGIECQAMEGAVFHIHQHVAIFDHGSPVSLPANLGQTGTCLYWIHTHTADGIIHIESPKFRTFTLSNMFDIWGEPFTATSVATARVKKGQIRVYVNGNRYYADPAKIELAQHTDITIEAGPPYAKPVLFTDWGGN